MEESIKVPAQMNIITICFRCRYVNCWEGRIVSMVHAHLSESAVVEHCYLICTLYGTQPVSYDKHRATWEEGGGRREEGERKTTRRGREMMMI